LSLASGFCADNIKVFFSPKVGCAEAVVEQLGKASLSVLVQAYLFTAARIMKALVDAKRRGLNGQVISDMSQRSEECPPADSLRISCGLETA
jgi:phosphatidylserine/phosphatidylglycerophosphate/cardiolipin synthase-like enzyme